MFRFSWPSFLRLPSAVANTPPAFRLVFAALSGAALALSYSGWYLTIYSWVCVGILLIAIFGTRPSVAFACGFVHAGQLSNDDPTSDPSSAAAPVFGR